MTKTDRIVSDSHPCLECFQHYPGEKPVRESTSQEDLLAAVPVTDRPRTRPIRADEELL